MKRVVVECDPDEVLMRKLGFGKKEIIHGGGKGEVLNLLLKDNSVTIGMVDEDPHSPDPKKVSEFNLLANKHGVKFLRHRNKHFHLIILCPRIEDWLYEQCNASGLNPSDFRLPSSAKEFKNIINDHLPRVDKFIDTLLEKNNDGVIFLKQILHACQENQ